MLPNHWHFILWPKHDGELTTFLRWLTLTHTQRWHAHHHTAGSGHLYQGRFKAFPIEDDDHFLTALRYVERNALRANLCSGAEEWRFGSLHHRAVTHTDRATGMPSMREILSEGPLPLPGDWIERVNQPETEAELKAIRQSVIRGQPFGSAAWQATAAHHLGRQTTFRPRGRPKKPTNGPGEEGVAEK